MTIQIFDKDQPEMQAIFALLELTIPVIQSSKYHPEGSVFNHSIQCFNWARKEAYNVDLMLAALLHDIGKVDKSHGHEKIARQYLEGIVSYKTLWLIEQHMRIWTLVLGEMRKHSLVMDLIHHPWLSDIILLARWDKMSRNPNIQHTVLNKGMEDHIVDSLNYRAQMHFTENLEGV